MANTAYLHARGRPGYRQPQVQATRDMRKAYRQIPITERQGWFQKIAAWIQETKCYAFAHLHGLAFGLHASVAHFNRVPSFLLALARRFFGIPATAYLDDGRKSACVECFWMAPGNSRMRLRHSDGCSEWPERLFFWFR